MIVVPGPASKTLGSEIAELVKAEAPTLQFKQFPDGESYLRLSEDVRGEDVVLVQTMGPPQDSRLMQALFIADAASDLGAKSITLVAPYLAYARQDRRFLEGEASTLRTLMKMMKISGVSRLITLNAHSPVTIKTLGKEFGIDYEDLSAIPTLAEWFKEKGLGGAMALTMGKKALTMAMEADRVLGGGYACLETQRDLVTGKSMIKSDVVDLVGKFVIVFDDIISSGGTMVETIKVVRARRAGEVYASCVHPVLIGDALQRIKDSGAADVVATNSIDSPVSVVSVAPLIAKALK